MKLRYKNLATPPDSTVTTGALSGITKIDSFLHQIRLSSDRWGYQELQDYFPGQLCQLEPNDNRHKGQRGKFDRAALFHLPKTRKQIKIIYNPPHSFYPYSMFFITQPTVEELLELDLCFSLGSTGHLKFSSIEYTTDYYCKSSTDVGNLFYVLRRNYYCPYAKRTKTIGREFDGYSHSQNYSATRKSNVLYFINFSKEGARNRKLIKFYERGADNFKKDNKWGHQFCDRVRFEVTARKTLLNHLGIKTIPHLLANPHFSNLIFPHNGRSLFQFRMFRERSYRRYSPPSIHQNYYNSASDETFESFLEESFYAKQQGFDLSNSIAPYDGLNSLIRDTKQSIKEFEEDWMSEAADRVVEAFGHYNI